MGLKIWSNSGRTKLLPYDQVTLRKCMTWNKNSGLGCRILFGDNQTTSSKYNGKDKLAIQLNVVVCESPSVLRLKFQNNFPLHGFQ